MAEVEDVNRAMLPLTMIPQQIPTSTEDAESGDYCRICRGEGTHEQPLFHPCKCSGSIKFVHQECLMEWLQHSQKKYCELCKTSFRFTKLYDHSMPERLPIRLFLQQLALHAGRRIARWLRYVLVVFVWVCWLPWSIRQVWRGLFWLADGSWMTPNDLHHLALTASKTTKLTSTTSMIPTIVAAGRSTEIWSIDTLPWSSALTFLDVFTGDALLKRLLRLISYKTFSNATSTLEMTVANSTDVSSPMATIVSGKKRSSILADVQSLNFFTKHPVLNNALIDLLEGQIVCLAVITAFILIFLIREWVVNQQPIHLMPDPDQAELPIPQANPEANLRQMGGRRRRMVIRRPLDAGLPNDPHIRDGVRRHRPVLRPRRAATDDNIVLVPTNLQIDAVPPALRRADSLQIPIYRTGFNPPNSPEGDSPAVVLDEVAQRQDLSSPPLQRGIFDDVVDIRRNIEENSSQEARDYEKFLANRSAAEIAADEEHENWLQTGEAPHVLNPDLFSNSPHFDLAAADLEALTSRRQSKGENIHDASSEDDWADISTSGERTTATNAAADQPEDPADIQQDNADQQSAVIQAQTPIGEALADHFGFIDRVVLWLWDTDQYTLRQEPGTLPLAVQHDEEPAQAHFVRAPRPAQPQPVEPPAPELAPNIQWGIDANDPNVADDLEDVEGILELIGIEGPISGMFQNFVFSVLLISLTLAVSVWCPYIWGKIALLVISNPIGVFFKAPLFFVSRVADILVDLMLLVTGLLGYVLTNFVGSAKALIVPYVPIFKNVVQLRAAQEMTIGLSQRSSVRLEKAFSGTVLYLRPDLPTFSMQSLHVLRVLRSASFEAVSALGSDFMSTITAAEQLWHQKGLLAAPWLMAIELAAFPKTLLLVFGKASSWLENLSANLKMPEMSDPANVDYSLIQWSTKDRAFATIAGYILAISVACAYLQIAHRINNLGADERVGGILATSLRQAGGVVKVIVIIGIEMIVFPLYCGCLVDVALLPLFEGATISSRLAFVRRAPITGLFVHWFLGTCYMFHFALFVSMCRKILRKGVLYFIRDPEDPTFHPVRDVLERPVTVQLSKISFSAGVYGGLVMLCLGSVIWAISNFTGVFPIEWTANEPRLAFPLDIIFFNFFLPFILKRAEASRRIAVIYEWWFRSCADRLLLTKFLFIEDHGPESRPQAGTDTSQRALSEHDPPAEATSKENEKTHMAEMQRPSFNGRWVRAPASDAVRIPKGTPVFVEVDEDNNRIDGKPERDEGLHGRRDERFEKIYIPFQFKLRVCCFVFLVWLFAAFTGVVFTMGPLLTGRCIITLVAGLTRPPNDLYAITVGMHSWVLVGYAGLFLFDHMQYLKARSSGTALTVSRSCTWLYRAVCHTMGFIYIASAFGVVIPILLSLLVELYIHAPFYNYVLTSKIFEHAFTRGATDTRVENTSIPTIYMVQAWTLGILYLRVLLRIATTRPNPDTRAAIAIKLVMREGILPPNVRLATRAFILPVTVACAFLLTVPLVLAKLVMVAASIRNPDTVAKLYRNSYATILAIAVDMYLIFRLRKKVQGWQVDVRDEVYLRGERLHNFSDPPSSIKQIPLTPDRAEKNSDDEAMIVSPSLPTNGETTP